MKIKKTVNELIYAIIVWWNKNFTIIPIGQVSFTSSSFLIKIRSMPNFSSLLGDVTADDVTVTSSWHWWLPSSSTSSSSTTESARDVITSTSLHLQSSSASTTDVSGSRHSELIESSFWRHCSDTASTSGATSESVGVDDVRVTAAEVQIGDEHWNGKRNKDDGERRLEQTPNIRTVNFTFLRRQLLASLFRHIKFSSRRSQQTEVMRWYSCTHVEEAETVAVFLVRELVRSFSSVFRATCGSNNFYWRGGPEVE